MVKCLTQEHNMLVTAGFEPATFGLQVLDLTKHLTITIALIKLEYKHA